VLIHLIFGCTTKAMTTKFTTARHMGTSPTAVTVQGPKFCLNSVAGSAIERAQIGITGGALTMKRGIEELLAEIARRPRSAVGIGKDAF
jgi:hypothetical protein